MDSWSARTESSPSLIFWVNRKGLDSKAAQTLCALREASHFLAQTCSPAYCRLHRSYALTLLLPDSLVEVTSRDYSGAQSVASLWILV